ncbi:MAG: MBL fold metallo-hydrolase [Ruminococcus sp.]|nr:MBL fold metallo-hydrolase [Ruminococcus sp.]
MLLEFFGRGSAFTDEHNSAFFTDGSDLVLIDHSLPAFNRLRRRHELACADAAGQGFKHIYIIVTHTHSDHIGGIPLLIHYAYYVWHTPVTIAAASEEVGGLLRILFDKIEGCEDGSYEIVPADTLKWVNKVIPTRHTPALDGKCFGYLLNIGGKKAVYTGDTRTLEPFLPYIDGDTELYCEAAAFNSGVHLFIDDIIPTLKEIAAGGAKVYLMHLDNEEAILKAIDGTDISFVTVYDGS